ncbi:phosphatidylserine/phosphatidylglycerophosphate/cardiolipin synthase-like enzyme [Pseudomonas lini]|uniref:phospholipase D-like domain-containing protein n=1 Tax=Pseudomonas lini TaxID=163011 RepID=UPI00277E0ACC|nr:phospholipase D-like domain-containing protein [Pseudomonas lini]MDQ0125517.1 phosphatidylserine/phosphatidylglycerophosphate/cardiolipin synthase-like enzyme [Pseudomonas lini]
MTKTENRQKIFVKVPFGFGTFRLKISRSQKWGAIDLMILISLIESPKTSQTLSSESCLPRQLIVEILIPLMKAGWIEIINSDSEFLFALTERGMAVSGNEELPSNQVPMSVVRSFLIDPLTGDCYRFEKKKRKQNYLIYKAGKATSLAKQYGSHCVELKVKYPKFSPKLTEILNCLPNENEEIVGIEDEYIKENFSDSLRYMLACVDNEDQVSGIPDISMELKGAIIDAAKNQRKVLAESASTTIPLRHKGKVFEVDSLERHFKAREVEVGRVNIISGGEQHRQHLFDSIKNAHTRLIIHTTFINPSTAEEIFVELLESGKKRVKVDILWGQTEPGEANKVQQYNELVHAIEKFQQRINSEGLSTQINFHTTPTGSHSKFIVTDSADGSWSLTVGSCNWLSSGFNRFEASVQIRDSILVSDCLNIASDLATGRYGVANMLSRDLAMEASRIYKTAESIPPSGGNTVEAQILTSAEHHAAIKQASESVVDSFFICSHRFSFAAERPILTPLIAARKANPDLSIRVAYGRSSGAMKNKDAKSVNDELQSLGFKITKADDPQIHAKFVIWDDTNLIVSSLNWLSASSKGHDFSELGVYLSGANFGDKLMNSFNQLYENS